MKELMKVNFGEDKMTVSARELHECLGIKTRFTTWMERMLEFGFSETDYETCFPNLGSKMHGGHNLMDYQISVDMAKQICMVQKNKLGRLYRQYFLDLEKAWNTPEQVMRRALQMAKKSEEELKQKCNMLGSEVIKQQAMIEEMAPKVSYLDKILQCPSLVLTTQIAKDYGYSARAFNQLLHHYNIQYKANDQWVLYAAYQGKGYVHSTTYSVKSGNEIIRIRMQTEWTQKGRRFLYDFLKKEGIVPMIERGNTNAGGSK